eukprot:5906855-Lingulodinium_polyedra.AAC.1
MISHQNRAAILETLSANFVGVGVQQYRSYTELFPEAPRRASRARRAYDAWQMFTHKKLKACGPHWNSCSASGF